jgi:hypothetical protein
MPVIESFPCLMERNWEAVGQMLIKPDTPQEALSYLSAISDRVMTALSGLSKHDGKRCPDCEAYLLVTLIRMGMVARQIAEGLDLVPADRPRPIRLPTSDIEAEAN